MNTNVMPKSQFLCVKFIELINSFWKLGHLFCCALGTAAAWPTCPYLLLAKWLAGRKEQDRNNFPCFCLLWIDHSLCKSTCWIEYPSVPTCPQVTCKIMFVVHSFDHKTLAFCQLVSGLMLRNMASVRTFLLQGIFGIISFSTEV